MGRGRALLTRIWQNPLHTGRAGTLWSLDHNGDQREDTLQPAGKGRSKVRDGTGCCGAVSKNPYPKWEGPGPCSGPNSFYFLIQFPANRCLGSGDTAGNDQSAWAPDTYVADWDEVPGSWLHPAPTFAVGSWGVNQEDREQLSLALTVCVCVTLHLPGLGRMTSHARPWL